ncbi:hypothetical protein BGW37DRAFT_486440 [Umbelopsis sp. PMI_123]|nr:hypothetical protein BGW37DRAFT_486440 [Umbelopsis sp. PMI_123]
MRPRYNYASTSHQDDKDAREPNSSLTVDSSHSWKKYDSFKRSSPFRAGSTSPVSSISADLGPFLSPVPGHGIQGFRASTPRIHHQESTGSVSSQSYVEKSSIPSPEQSYAAWAAKEDSQRSREETSIQSKDKNQHNYSEMIEQQDSDASSWSFAEAASINHPSVHGLSNSRPPSRYFSSNSENDDMDGEVANVNKRNMSDAVVEGDEEDHEDYRQEDGEEDHETHEEDDDILPNSLLLRQNASKESNRDQRSEQSHRNFLSSSFEHPNTRMWQKKGSTNTSLLSQRLDRYRRDNSLNKIDRIEYSPDRHQHEADQQSPQLRSRQESLDRMRYRATESRQSDFSSKSRSRLRETWRASISPRRGRGEVGSGSHYSLEKDNERSNLQLSSRSPSIASPRMLKSADPKVLNHQLSQSERDPQPRNKHLQSSDFSPNLYSHHTQDKHPSPNSTSSKAPQIKQAQVKVISKTLAKLEKLLDDDVSVMSAGATDRSSKKQPKHTEDNWVQEGYDDRPDSVSILETGSSKTQRLLSRIWQLQMSLDAKETELSDVRRHSRWLEEQLSSARRRIDKLEQDAESRHRLQEQLYKAEETANEANHRVTDLLQINYKLVNDQEAVMQQQVNQVTLAQIPGRETPLMNHYKDKPTRHRPFSRSSTGDFTNMRMAELQNRLKRLWDDSRQLEEYVKERSSSRLSAHVSPERPRNPSPRLLTQRNDDAAQDIEYGENSDANDSASDNLVDLLKLLRSESELHRHQLVKTVQLLAANVAGNDSLSLNEEHRDRNVHIPNNLTILAKKIQMMERRYEEREKQLNRIIGINQFKNKQSILRWKKRWENQIDEWPAVVEPLLTQLDEDDDDEVEEDVDEMQNQLDDDEDIVEHDK